MPHRRSFRPTPARGLHGTVAIRCGPHFMNPDFIAGNRVALLQSGTEYFPALEQAMAAAREEIIGAVRDKFQIILEQEPLELTLSQ